jgi:hypothetical protein
MNSVELVTPIIERQTDLEPSGALLEQYFLLVIFRAQTVENDVFFALEADFLHKHPEAIDSATNWQNLTELLLGLAVLFNLEVIQEACREILHTRQGANTFLLN